MSDLTKLMDKLNIEEADAKADVLIRYMEKVLQWNEKVNLTAITDREEFVHKHLVDSLLCAETLEFTESSSICDVGTGGGFPGVPLAVCYPEKDFVLMDSLAKRIKIVQQICDELSIKNVRAVHGRAEDLARTEDYREAFDLCVSRAVANMRVLSEYCIPFVRVGGSFIAYKGADCESEIDDSKEAIRRLGGGETEIRKLPHLGHSLVIIKKVSPTPKTYPRKAGTPARKPL